MSLPSIPGRDLAKLVLGYLAEEQLMTAYDEFLQASPYLDALENEYDRIFMTSLKHIVSEYRALRILVETCQPFELRQKLLKCSNLVEMVKFLVCNVDLLKISQHHKLDKSCSVRLRDCGKCSVNEVCHCRKSIPSAQYVFTPRTSNVNLNLDATPLANLPGNNPTTLRKDKSENLKLVDSQQYFNNTLLSTQTVTRLEDTQQNSSCLSMKTHNGVQSVSRDNTVVDNVVTTDLNYDYDRRMSTAVALQDFANGYISGKQTVTPVSEWACANASNNVIELSSKTVNINNPLQTARKIKRTQYLVQVTNSNNVNLPTDGTFTKSKIDDHKVMILSNIVVEKDLLSTVHKNKVDKSVQDKPKPVRTQSIVNVNGTLAYRPDDHTFTKDEIMAMPTILVVPASGQSQATTQVTDTTTSAPLLVSSSSSVNSLGPLTIDVSSPVTKKQPDLPILNASSSGLITTMDLKNASLPKENTVKTSTPQVLPPQRKSSSTPRRTSHVRVLDFTTPRRILQETINEKPEEIVVSKSPNLHFSTGIGTQQKLESANTATDTDSSKENNTNTLSSVKPKNKCWDTELRALIANEAKSSEKSSLKNKTKKPPKKKKSAEKSKESSETETKKSSSKKSTSPKSPKGKSAKKSKRKSKEKVVEEAPAPPAEIKAIKPTINIICDWNKSPAKEVEKPENSNKSGSDNQTDTPDLERLSLHNVIGAELNISDLLETPFKQAIYDIQMETPRFLRPDMPDEPLSEIKISDIPTPMFLNTPNVIAVTPSSYSSRPTDYSSGGSYYKPDEQDYPILPDLDYPVSKAEPTQSTTIISTEDSTKIENKDSAKVKTPASKPSRPVRQCTKNVTYCDTKVTNEHQARVDVSSSDTDSAGNSTFNDEDNKNDSKALKKDSSKAKPEPKRKSMNISVRSRRSSIKKSSPKTFMKIKPRRPTPTKLNLSKIKKDVLSESPSNTRSPKSVSKKRVTSKDKSTHSSPVVTPAPTKSRRKSSTPRKLPTKVYNHESPNISPENRNEDIPKFIATTVQDSDSEKFSLRWSDEGSFSSAERNSKTNSRESTKKLDDECENIYNIQEYIETTRKKSVELSIGGKQGNDEEGSLHLDLVKRGFDFETAKKIERDLLDPSPSSKDESSIMTSCENTVIGITTDIETESACSAKDVPNEIESSVEKVAEVSSENTSKDLSADEKNENEDEVELSNCECNEDSANFKSYVYNSDAVEPSTHDTSFFKDTYSMEICIEEDVIRLRTTQFVDLFDNKPDDENLQTYSHVETEAAVDSISNIERLYTPMKDDRRTSIQAQCIEIFESSLTSLDTPMKSSPRRSNVTVSEIVLEVEQVVEKVDVKDKQTKKRKRGQSVSTSEEDTVENKRNKRETRILPNIQNFDIETVLCKLHGP